MPQQIPRCSIILRSYNEEKHIGKLLTGIQQQTIDEVEIILVDSGSQDMTVEIAKENNVSVLSIQPEEFTFGRSFNRGCALARGEFLVLASSHVYPTYPDWLEQLLAAFEDSKVALAYGKQRGNHTTKFSEHQMFKTLYPEKSNLHQDHPFCNNANAAIRRELWQQRPYNESLPGLEDLEWATWALTQGYHVAYMAEAEVIHIHDETPRQVYNRYRREAMALKQFQPWQRFNIWDLLRLYTSNVTSDIWQGLRQRRLLRELPGILWFRWMQFLGTYRGFKYIGPLTPDLKRAFYYPRSNKVSETSARDIIPLDYGQVRDPENKG